MRLVKYLLFLVGLTPLIVGRGVFFEAVSGKTFFFSLIVVLVGLVFIYQLIKDIDYRKNILTKVKNLIENKLFIAVSVFIALSLVSALFAFDKHIAFWGDVERGSGFVNLLMLYVFFVLSVVNFQKEDWVNFFKIGLFVSIIVIGKEVSQFLGGVSRPGSFIGNPAFLAGYLLYSITGSIIVFFSDTEKFWRFISLSILVLSIFGLALTETRSAILGFAVGGVCMLIYFILKDNNLKVKNVSVKKISASMLTIASLLALVFLVTIKSDFWKGVPVLSRVSEIGEGDKTTSSRFLAWESSLQSVNPKTQTKEFIIGWGPENSTLALGKYFNPQQYKYDSTNFDRSHNKFLDVFVMSGIFTLVSYVLIWILVFMALIKRDFSLTNSALLFFFASFFVHMIFVFDQNPQSIMMFLLVGFLIFNQGKLDKDEPLGKARKGAIFYFLVFLTLLNTVFFIRGTLISHIQMKKYSALTVSVNNNTLQKINSVFGFSTPAQTNIRRHFLEKTSEMYGEFDNDIDKKVLTEKLFNIAIDRAEQYTKERPYDFRFFSYIAGAYNKKFEIGENIDDLKRSEFYMRKALTFAPNRQELNNNLVFNLLNQERFEEALEVVNKNIERDPELSSPYLYKGVLLSSMGSNNYKESLSNFERFLDLDEEGFAENRIIINISYEKFIQFFYIIKDKDSFVITSKRLISNNHKMSKSLENIITSLNSGVWPNIDFK